ncbi:putative reverse transcriptase domain-containing protein [Tanacetum coccineum]
MKKLMVDLLPLVETPKELTNESHVLLKVPKKDNMYSIDLKNVVPQGGLTCLFAKATLDESNLWHRRLGHINFKMRGNLVRGLLSKIFENDHTCVACQKGKQHKASYPLEDGVRCQRCTCERCRCHLSEGFCSFCKSEAGNSFIYDSNPNSFINLPNVFTHPPQRQYKTYSCELCGNDSHYGYDCPPRLPLLLQQKKAASINQSPLQEMSIQDMEDLKQHYLDEMLSLGNDLQIKDYQNEKIDIHFRRECESMIDKLKGKFNGMSIEINKKKKLQHLEQVANLSNYPSQRFKSFCYDDDDDYDYKESTIPLNEIDSQIPSSIAIIPVLPTLEPEDSLIIGNKELSTIFEKESDEFIKSSVEDLVPILSKSEDTFRSNSDCDLPSCDDFSPINGSEEKSVTFSNPLFDSNNNFTSSNDESLSDKDVSKDNNIESKDSYVSNFDEPALLVTPLSDVNVDECFNLGGDVNEIEFLLHRDPSTPKLSIASILEGFTDEPPLEENDDLFDLESKENELKKILYDASIDDLMTEDKVFDPGIHEKVFSPTYVKLPYEDRHYLSFTYDCLDFEDSCARGFVPRSLDLQSLACFYMGIRYPRSY